MKQLVLSIAFVCSIISTTIANNNMPSHVVQQNFAHEFGQIKNVRWEISDVNSAIYIAHFQFNNENLEALFTEEGEFLGTTRAIEKEQLPILVTKSLTTKYNMDDIRGMIEFSAPEGLNYYITIETKKGGIVIKANSTGSISTCKKLK